MHKRTVSAFEDRTDRCLDAFPFESRAAAKKYLYLLDQGYEGKPVGEHDPHIRIVRGHSKGFIDWWGNVTWGPNE